MAEHPNDERRTAAESGSSESANPKQPYEAPRLIDYGTVAELTQGGGGTQADGVSGKRFVKA